MSGIGLQAVDFIDEYNTNDRMSGPGSQSRYSEHPVAVS